MKRGKAKKVNQDSDERTKRFKKKESRPENCIKEMRKYICKCSHVSKYPSVLRQTRIDADTNKLPIYKKHTQ